MPALLLESTSSTPTHGAFELIGSTSFGAPAQVVRWPYPRLVDKSERFERNPPLDAAEEHVVKAVEQALKTARAMYEVKDRIQTLLDDAIIAGEQHSPASAADMKSFL